jgi:hypothetical protein
MTDFRARGTIMGLAGLTAVFGMGTGVAPPVWSPGNRPGDCHAARPQANRSLITQTSQEASKRDVDHSIVSPCVAPRGKRREFATALGYGKRDPDIPGTTTGVAGDGSGWSSDRLLELVRCDARAPCTPSPSTWSSSRSLRSLRYWKPRLEEGFALRCLQRLSFPDLATRRCPERDSRHTRGRSSPILSY